ncbi:pre-mRNA-splicing factor syf1 [Sorochytrium milnesiophthora]
MDGDAVELGGDEHSSSSSKALAFSCISEDDLAYEDDLVRDPYSIKTWARYIAHKRSYVGSQPESHLLVLYERAVMCLPGSYKLWKQYLALCKNRLKTMRGWQREHEAIRVQGCYERCLVQLYMMPRLWLEYAAFLMAYRGHLVPRIMKTFDRALQSLPITQHARIWDVYLKWISSPHVGGEVAARVYRRYLKARQIESSKFDDYISLLTSMERYNDAATELIKFLVDEQAHRNVPPKQVYTRLLSLCEIITKHPGELDASVPVAKVVLAGIARFPELVGKLWVSLGQYYIMKGRLETARSVFEQGLRKVMAVKDFTTVFEAYAEFDESVVSALMEQADDDGDADSVELDMRLARLEHLMDRRPFLVNDVLLRQNPHNCHEWLKRVALCKGNHAKIVETFEKAVATIMPRRATGKFSDVWVAYAKHCEENVSDLEAARAVFDRAVQVHFKTVDELAECWCEYAEMELRHDQFERALEVMGQATAPPMNPNVSYHDEKLPVQIRVFKSLKLWSFYIDLEESLGTVDTTKLVYDRVLDLKIATPQIVINYARFLEERQYFEDSFKAYERGIEQFGYPVAYEIWNIYLSKFLERYGGSKLERARDLFEMSLDGCPEKYCKNFYIMYGNLEEEHGLARRAMRVYERATRAVAKDQRFEMFKYYISKAQSFFGVTATRDIYQKAIEVLPDREAKEMCLQYADLERSLGEVDRARAVYAHGSQFCDPRTHPGYWDVWQDFEIKYGNEDTFKEMLRIKRSVQAQYNTEVNYISAQLLAVRQAREQEAPASSEQQQTDEQAAKTIRFVASASSGGQEVAEKAHNPDEIGLSDDDDDDEDREDAEEEPSAKKRKIH